MNDVAEASRHSTELCGSTEGSVSQTLTGDALGLDWFYKTFTDVRLYCVRSITWLTRFLQSFRAPLRVSGKSCESKRKTIGDVMVLFLLHKSFLISESSRFRLRSEGVAAFSWCFCELLRRRCQEGFTVLYGRCPVFS